MLIGASSHFIWRGASTSLRICAVPGRRKVDIGRIMACTTRLNIIEIHQSKPDDNLGQKRFSLNWPSNIDAAKACRLRACRRPAISLNSMTHRRTMNRCRHRDAHLASMPLPTAPEFILPMPAEYSSATGFNALSPMSEGGRKYSSCSLIP